MMYWCIPVNTYGEPKFDGGENVDCESSLEDEIEYGEGTSAIPSNRNSCVPVKQVLIASYSSII